MFVDSTKGKTAKVIFEAPEGDRAIPAIAVIIALKPLWVRRGGSSCWDQCCACEQPGQRLEDLFQTWLSFRQSP